VQAPLCVLAIAKPGGANNSLLPVMWGVVLLSLLFLDQPEPAETGTERCRATLRGCLFALAASLTICSQVVWSLNFLRFAQGDKNYPRIIEIAAALPGKVISPDDPTIALRAKGYLGRCGQLERDAKGPPMEAPVPLARQEAATADWYIAVKWSYLPAVEPDVLTSLGFVEVPIDLAGSVYHLWKRQNPATQTAPH
jgi:hypothetical protein